MRLDFGDNTFIFDKVGKISFSGGDVVIDGKKIDSAGGNVKIVVNGSVDTLVLDDSAELDR